MREFVARVERRRELDEDRERLERIRLGQATAALLNMWRSDRSAPIDATDVFPDLKDEPKIMMDDDDDSRGAHAILQMFRAMAASQKAHSA